MRTRSLLYVPASRPRMLEKLPSLPADAVVLDLEDGVAPGEKSAARTNLREAAEGGLLEAAPPWAVRIHAVGGSEQAGDLELARAIAAPRVVLPKAESVSEVARLGREVGGWGGSLGLMIETVPGVARVRELAAQPGVAWLILGSADYRLSIGARPDRSRRWELLALQELLLAARLHGRLAIDSVYFHFRDVDGLREHAAIGRELGYDGKSCIHPDQLPVVHEVYRSSAEEAKWARDVLRVWSEQGGARRGVVVLDGEMIEALHVELARRILEGTEPL